MDTIMGYGIYKTLTGTYKPTNPGKYIGSNVPIFRSSWELVFMQFCDKNDYVVEWASEPLRIPYYNPIKNKQTVYVPDFLVVYLDKQKRRIAELVEIKPKKETLPEAAKSNKDKIQLHINTLKWQAAAKYAKSNGLKFRVLTEEHIFEKY